MRLKNLVMEPDSITRRLRALRLLMRTMNGKTSVDIEAAIAEHTTRSKIPCDYEAKVRQLAWNLSKTPALLEYTPEVLVRLDNKTMARGTDIEQWTSEFEIEMANEAQLVNSDTQSNSTSLLKCRRCKSDRISTKQVQTRSADEAMTVFCSCDNCNLRWKM